MSGQHLSDKAISILVLAAYHSLSSGETVGQIVLDDGHGHTADADGLGELHAEGLLEVNGTRGRLTEAGSEELQIIIDAIRASQT
ncbi:hypothetical protein Sa4125_42520 [Aureimonas sp. SA4125]|uniref:hypothetical protein n=1 Tax=Aureimonas sp. SA4125 TaxID=2826993 RepID=UPI001CC7DE7C|nr:hypothetical protein [Aureimonas sp. SA4125]BDA86710.1 hypothetical protein Sa4125_42520 [Aureimonas sp. SA4125]